MLYTEEAIAEITERMKRPPTKEGTFLLDAGRITPIENLCEDAYSVLDTSWNGRGDNGIVVGKVELVKRGDAMSLSRFRVTGKFYYM